MDEAQPLDVWIHSGDFPREMYPPYVMREVGYSEYAASSDSVCQKLGLKIGSPQHHLGYTIFFQGLFWILHNLQPTQIYTLGFDHDYNQAKVAKWLQSGQPGPQNQYKKPLNQPIREWAAQFFSDEQPDAFYGHGTPDPMRLGEAELARLFTQALDYGERLGCKLFNASNAVFTRNVFPRKSIS